MKVLLFLILNAMLATVAGASSYYVSPNGTSSGSGTIASPWDLQTALNQPSAVHAGDTIWIMGGSYKGSFISTLNGTASSPIIVRNYKGQRATIDGSSACSGLVLTVNGSYVWYWGLEITDSTAVVSGSVCQPFGVGVYGGPGDKFINMIVHNTGEGFSAYNASPDSEFYGNLVYYNGFVGSDRNYGHGMYLQNSSGEKLVSDNIIGDNAFEGIQIYGSGSASLVNFTVSGNAFYDTDSWPTSNNYQYNLIIAGGKTRQNISVQNNYSYFPLSATTGYTSFGGYTDGQDMTIQNNVFVGGYTPFGVSNQGGPVTVTGNTIYASTASLRLLSLILDTNQSLASYTWDNNVYYDRSQYGFYNAQTTNGTVSGVNAFFGMWKSQTGFDQHSKYNQSAPTGSWIFVRPNKYEPKRANIVVYNWDLSTTASVDLSSVLVPGDRYVIQDAQNFYGPAVATGTFSGSPISIPMNGLLKEKPVGFATPAHTAPQFGTFVLLQVNTDSPAPPTNLTVNVS